MGIAVMSTALAELSWLLYRRGQNNEARLYTLQTWQLAVQIHDEYQRIRSLRLLGALRYNQGYLSSGIRANQVALLRARRLGHPESIANSLNNLAVAYIRQQRYSEVIPLLGESLQIFEQLGQHQRVALTLSNLAMSAYYKGDYPAAQMYVVRSMSIYHDIGEQVLLSYTEVGAGPISTAIGDLSRAEGFFHSGLQHARMAGLNPTILWALCGLAELRRRTGDRALAITVVGFVQHHPDLNASVHELLDPLVEALRYEEDDLAMIEQNLAPGRSSSFE
jgi:tetratricopeptide (TPR) repeat protein